MAAEIRPERRPLAFELALVVLVAAAVLVPGIWRYSLVDPWETHYGEVAREMLQNHDLVHTTWAGASLGGNLDENEGFRSKPVLSMWMMAASLELTGVARDGGYSGELTESAWTMFAVRIPFVLTAIAGLALMWWMLARLCSRRLAWLALLVVGSSPFYGLVARQAIPDMPLVATTVGAIALFIMAMEDGARPVSHVATIRGIRLDARHVVLGIAGGFVLVQAAYYAVYFAMAPQLAINGRMITPAIWLPLLMVALFGAIARDGWLILRLPFVLVGGVIAAIANEPLPRRRPQQSRWRAIVDNTLVPWERHALDRYLVRAIVAPTLWVMRTPRVWRATNGVADRVLRMAPITTMRQLYLLGCYFLLGMGVLAKGPPGLAVVGGVGVLYVVVLGRWRAFYEGDFELKRGLLLVIVTFLPWHLAMFLKDGPTFLNEYLFQHILNRAAVGTVDNSPGTFESYTSQLGHGMWLWAALVPAALGGLVSRLRLDERAGRVRFVIGLWAVVAMALFCLVQTKFHHYILPVVPALGVLVAFFLDDLLARRDRLHPLFAALAAGIVLLICRDLMHEPDRWIEMFVFLYNRPWPAGDPWNVDPSDGFLALGILAVIALAIAGTRFVRTGVAALAAVGLAIGIWALQVYMPIAGTHWGMREAMRTYYAQRTIYGEHLVYFSAAELRADWQDAGDTWSFETMIPDDQQIDQPMTVTVELRKATDEKVVEAKIELLGTVRSLGAHRITLALRPGERAKLAPLLAKTGSAAARRPALRLVAADPLLAYQLYWRGEQFWSAGEIWGWLPETKTSFPNTNNVELGKYLNDRSRAPLGPRYFVIGPGGALGGIRSAIPTPHGKATFEVLDSTSNKFSIGAFEL